MSTEGERRHWRKQWHTRSPGYMGRTNAHKKLYRQTDTGKANSAAAVARVVLKYPEKTRARVAVRNAVLSGALVKQRCQVCGDPNSEGHHEDYDKPLDVKWLCNYHHCELEGRLLPMNRRPPQ